LGHMQRHMREHAATDVYYVQQNCKGSLSSPGAGCRLG
jgi:hypothetical protein